jgi:hypothetical protein
MSRSLTTDLEFRALDKRSWRLCDRRASARDSASLVAYVELVRGGYDVVWMQGSVKPSTFQSLDEVLAAAAVRRPSPQPRPSVQPDRRVVAHPKQSLSQRGSAR